MAFKPISKSFDAVLARIAERGLDSDPFYEGRGVHLADEIEDWERIVVEDDEEPVRELVFH